MKATKRVACLAWICLATAAAASGQAYSPVVEMAITLPDGKTETLTAPESGLATTTVAGGEFGFRPTLVDDKPWTHVIVTIFRMATQSQPTQELGQVDLKTGASPATSKTTPSFKVAVTSVKPPVS
ncbi:MAG TPA: hypothetical protein VKX49_10050 [Bryobacteraceae bacterium]|nr:hypothetical protein [Bryobacteraceae bacterium]